MIASIQLMLEGSTFWTYGVLRRCGKQNGNRRVRNVFKNKAKKRRRNLYSSFNEVAVAEHLHTGNLFLVKTEDEWYFVSCILRNTAQLGNSSPVKAFSAFDGKFSPKIPQGQIGHSYRVKACSPFLKRRINVASLSRLTTAVTRDCQKTNGMRWMIDSLCCVISLNFFFSSPNSRTITSCCN